MSHLLAGVYNRTSSVLAASVWTIPIYFVLYWQYYMTNWWNSSLLAQFGAITLLCSWGISHPNQDWRQSRCSILLSRDHNIKKIEGCYRAVQWGQDVLFLIWRIQCQRAYTKSIPYREYLLNLVLMTLTPRSYYLCTDNHEHPYSCSITLCLRRVVLSLFVTTAKNCSFNILYWYCAYTNNIVTVVNSSAVGLP